MQLDLSFNPGAYDGSASIRLGAISSAAADKTVHWRILGTEMDAGHSGAVELGASPASRSINSTVVTVTNIEGRPVTWSTITGIALHLRPARTADGVTYLTTQTVEMATTNSSTSATLSAANDLIQPGMDVTGTGIAASTTVSAISGTTVTLSAAATATGTAQITFSFSAEVDFTIADLYAPPEVVLTGTLTSGSASVTSISSTATIIQGMRVTGTGIPAGTTIASVDSGTAITLSANATATGATSLTFGGAPNMHRLKIDPTSSVSAMAILARATPSVSSMVEVHRVSGPAALMEAVIVVEGE